MLPGVIANRISNPSKKIQVFSCCSKVIRAEWPQKYELGLIKPNVPVADMSAKNLTKPYCEHIERLRFVKVLEGSYFALLLQSEVLDKMVLY